MKKIKLTKKQRKNIKKMFKSLCNKKLIYCKWWNNVQLEYSTKKNEIELIHWAEIVLRYNFKQSNVGTKEMMKMSIKNY